MEQLELDLGCTPVIPSTVLFDLVLPLDEGVERYAVDYESALKLRKELTEWLDFVEARANGR